MNEKKIEFVTKLEIFWERNEKFLKLNPSGEVPVLIDLDNTDTLISTAYSPTQFLSKIFSDVGTAVNKASRDYEIQDLRLQDMEELRSSISGVDLDTEAARLLEQQQAYQALAKVLSTAKEMVDTLLRFM